MSIVDRVEAARHTMKGSPIGRAVTKATSREIIGPKKKHVDYLLGSLNEDNVNIPELGDLLFERCTNTNWVIVFKSLITCHHMLSNGNERFLQYCASRSVTWLLQNFLDKSGVQGYDMSYIIRRYSHYLNEKAKCYMEMGYDFCRIPRGKKDGVLRNADVQKLLKALPVIQKQIDAVISTQIRASDLVNGVVTAAFMLLFKDLIRLFACYNDGIINLVEKYFDMKKLDCRAALDIYKKFINRMEQVSEFLKTAEDVGIDRGDIPDLAKAPGSLLEALENHLQALEKGRTVSPPAHPINLPTISVNANAGSSADPFQAQPFDGVDAEYLEQEKKALEMFEKNKLHTTKQQPFGFSSSPPKATEKTPVIAAPPQKHSAAEHTSHQRSQQHLQQQQQQRQQQQQQQPKVSATNDLLELNSAFALSAPDSGCSRSVSVPLFDQAAWVGQSGPAVPNGTTQLSSTNPFAQNNTYFATAFPTQGAGNTADLLGDVLEPTVLSGNYPGPTRGSEMTVSSGKDINSSLARITKSLDDLTVNANTQKAASSKGQHQWKPQQPQQRTGGANFQNIGPARSTLPPMSTQPGWGHPGGGVPPMGGFSQPMPYSTTGTSYGFGQPSMQTNPMMGQPRPPMAASGGAIFPSGNMQDPFGPIPGAQARF